MLHAITAVEVAAPLVVMAAEAVRAVMEEVEARLTAEVDIAAGATRALAEVDRTAAEVGAVRTEAEEADIRIANPLS